MITEHAVVVVGALLLAICSLSGQARLSPVNPLPQVREAMYESVKLAAAIAVCTEHPRRPAAAAVGPAVVLHSPLLPLSVAG